MAYSTFPGDNRTFAGLLAVPPGVPEWRVLKRAAAFESAVSTIPTLRCWINPDMVEPLTDVMPMAGLRNALRYFDPVATTGFIPIGDAIAHTDPVMAHGLSFALIHAAEVTAAFRDCHDIGDAATAFATAVMPALRERFELASQLDAQRLRMWLGDPVDFAHRDGDYALFTVVAGAAAAAVDADAARVFLRRIGLLDSTRVLDDDEPMQRRFEAAFQQMAQVPRPPSGPSRADMAALVAEAVSSPA
jgi:hypothetical protein